MGDELSEEELEELITEILMKRMKGEMRRAMEQEPTMDERGVRETGAKSECMKLLVEQRGLEAIKNVINSMDVMNELGMELTKMVGPRTAIYSYLTFLMGGLDHLIKLGDGEFAKAIVTDLHRCIAAEKWPITTCIQIEEGE